MKFYISFGQKYASEPHPKGGHPNGLFLINADTEAEAREIAFDKLGMQWSMIYSEDNVKMKYYPRGVLKEITKHDTR